jgi:hypothetical protein
MAIGHWLLVVSCWLLVVGSPTNNKQQKANKTSIAAGQKLKL